MARMLQPDESEGRTGDGKGRLSLSIIEDLKNKGFSQSDIARMYGVTKQHVSWIKHTYGGRLTPREKMLRHFPFKVPEIMTRASPYKLLRHHAEFVATSGIGMSEDKLKRLRSFYRKMRNNKLVLEFDPSFPPEPGVSSTGGWAYRHRTADDGDLLIRVNAHTTLTVEGRSIWRLPTVDP